METYLTLPEAVLHKVPMKLAFDGAKDKYKNSGKDVSDDKLEWNEFRILLIFLRQYFKYWAMLEVLDASWDAQINLEEFHKAMPLLEKWGFLGKTAEELFKEIDTNNGRTITFDEFTKFAIAASLNLEEDDKRDNAALELLKN